MAAIKRTQQSFRRFYIYISERNLEQEMRERCMKHHTTLRDIYLDVRWSSVHAARLEIWWWLFSLGKSLNEIARMFDRDAASINFAVKRLKDYANTNNVRLTLETIHDIAKGVSALKLQKLQKENRDNEQ